MYARVAQVCKDDVIPERVLRNQWTSFLKARIRCTMNGFGGDEFSFNNLTSVSDVTRAVLRPEKGEEDVIYATFSTPW